MISTGCGCEITVSSYQNNHSAFSVGKHPFRTQAPFLAGNELQIKKESQLQPSTTAIAFFRATVEIVLT